MARGESKASLFSPRHARAGAVLGVLESAGLEFDHFVGSWVSPTKRGRWPSVAQSLIPCGCNAKRACRRPIRRFLEFDRRLTQGWLAAADEVVETHARAESDRELFMSPLIAGVRESPIEALALPPGESVNDAIRRAVVLERVDDRFGPPIAQAAQPAGTSLFRDQSACPFRAYARHRLGARALEAAGPGLDARERGNLMHWALAHAWRTLGDKAHLDALDARGRERLLAQAADSAIADLRKRRPDAMGGRFGAIERARLIAHLGAWLALEARRDDFTVVATEAKTPLAFGGVEVQARTRSHGSPRLGGYA
jgi:hypothetical protein